MSTTPENPLSGFTVTVVDPVPPCWRVREEGLRLSVKSGGDATVMFVVAVRVPDAPVAVAKKVAGKVPSVAFGETLTATG